MCIKLRTLETKILMLIVINLGVWIKARGKLLVDGHYKSALNHVFKHAKILSKIVMKNCFPLFFSCLACHEIFNNAIKTIKLIQYF